MKRIAIFFWFCITACQNHTPPQLSVIAHAGGGYKNKTYTNSIEALDHNYEKGFRLFEIDFIWTSDHQLVCLHDWDRTPKWLLNYHDEIPLTLDQFNQLKNQDLELKPCNLKRLNEWLNNHPLAFVVTDVKQNNLLALEKISQEVKNAKTRIIPQIYQPSEYAKTDELGFKNIIWTLYAYKGSNDDVIKEVSSMLLFAVTMPKHRAQQGLAKNLQNKQIPTYVHTINDLDEALSYINDFGVTSIYSDFLMDSALKTLAEF